MSTVKPDLTRVWAKDAPGSAIVDPDTTSAGKFAQGWRSEVPTYEHFNYLQKLFTQGLAHINEQGIPVWDANTLYPANALAKGSDGVVYNAINEQAGNDPTTDSVNWGVGIGSSTPVQQPRQIATAGQTNFDTPAVGNQNVKSFWMVIDGLMQRPTTDFIYNSGTNQLETTEGIAEGSKVDITFFQPSNIITAPTDAADINFSGDQPNVQEALEARLEKVSTLAELQGLGTQEENTVRDMIERTTGNFGGGKFIARVGDYSSQAVGDEVNTGQGDGGRWIAFGNDLTGASGAWERLDDGRNVDLDPTWYGVTLDSTDAAGNAEKLQAINAQTGFAYRRRIGLPPGRIKINALTFDGLRNVTFVGHGGSAVQPATVLELDDTVGVVYNAAGDKCQLLIRTGYFIDFESIAFVSTAAPSGPNDRQIVINASDTPAFSSHFVKFKGCAITCQSGVTFPTTPVLVYATKFFQLERSIISYPNNDAALQLGVDDGDAPDTLLKGACENVSIQGGFIFGDVILQNVRGLLIDEETQFDRLPSGNGGAAISSAGEEKASGVNIYATFLGPDNRGAAITQADRANSAQLIASSGWRVKSIFRDRLIGVDVTTGYIDLDGSIFQTRGNNTGTEIGVRIAEGAKKVNIGATTDFSVLQANNHIAVQDNRVEFHLLETTGATGAFTVGETVTDDTTLNTATVIAYETVTGTVKTTVPSGDFTVGGGISCDGETATLDNEYLSNERDSLVVSCELAQNYTLPSTGSFVTVLTRRAESKFIGGLYNITASVSIRSNFATRYRVQVLVNGSAIGVAKSLTLGSAEDSSISFSRDVLLPSDTTTPSTITLQVQQEDVGTAAIIRGDTTLGDTWIQVRKQG